MQVLPSFGGGLGGVVCLSAALKVFCVSLVEVVYLRRQNILL